MSSVHSTKPARVKPNKPYPEYPLCPHASGKWAKRIRGKLHYFGRWEDPPAALDEYLAVKDALHSGRRPVESADAMTVLHLTSAFLQHKEASRDAGELKHCSCEDYRTACREITAHFGKSRRLDDIGPADFAELRQKLSGRGWAPNTLAAVITRIKVAFKFGVDNGLIKQAIAYGQSFKPPSQKTQRLHRAKLGVKLFSRDEVRRMLDAAGPQLRGMLYLGVNAGCGNSDVGNLRFEHLDLDNGYLDYPRPKTGVARRAALWDETVAALRAAIEARPEPKDPADRDRVFISRRGTALAQDTADNPLSKQTTKLLRQLGINGRRGLGFYTLRHIFRTVADECRDQVAVDYAMGHSSGHISGHYREKISDERLRAVADFVWHWLHDPEPTAQGPDEPQPAPAPAAGGEAFKLRLLA
jgi:integrase